MASHFFKPAVVSKRYKLQWQKLPLKRLLWISALVATAYAIALFWAGDEAPLPWASLLSWTSLQAGLLCLLNYLLRGWRWRIWMAHFGRPLPWAQGLRLYVAGYAFTPTPGNAGEALRGLMLAHHPLSALQSLAIFGAERLADLLCLLLLCLPAASWLLNHSAVQTLMVKNSILATAALFVAVLGSVALAIWYWRHKLTTRLPWLHQAGLCLCVRPWHWFILTLLAWAAQGLALWLLCLQLQVHLPIATAIGFYAVSMVAGALSALPAGLGGTEAVLTGLLMAQGASSNTALSITVVARLLSLWLAVVLGWIALLYSAAVRKEINWSRF